MEADGSGRLEPSPSFQSVPIEAVYQRSSVSISGLFLDRYRDYLAGAVCLRSLPCLPSAR